MIDVPKDARVRLEPYLKALDMEPDKHWHSVPKWVLTLALSALDAQEAAGEGVTEEMVKIAAAAYMNSPGDAPFEDAMRAALLAVHPAIFAAGRARGRDEGLEKAAALLESGAAVSLPMVRAVLTNTAAALRMIKGGTP